MLGTFALLVGAVAFAVLFGVLVLCVLAGRVIGLCGDRHASPPNPRKSRS